MSLRPVFWETVPGCTKVVLYWVFNSFHNAFLDSLYGPISENHNFSCWLVMDFAKCQVLKETLGLAYWSKKQCNLENIYKGARISQKTKQKHQTTNDKQAESYRDALLSISVSEIRGQLWGESKDLIFCVFWMIPFLFNPISVGEIKNWCRSKVRI